ncbi:MAG TPA: thiolase family protein [Actinomycetes bacterium]|nr:thiolase family protein [Actinomycetes bacterium]
MQDPVVVVEGARTAIGTYGGSFKDTPTFELGAAAIRAALERAEVSPEEVDEVVLGCVGQVGPEAFNARRAALAADLPVTSNAYNVNRLCGSGLQAIWSAAMELTSGEATIAVAGGNENMSLQPFLDYRARSGYQLGDRTVLDGTLSLVTDPWGRYSMGVTAERVAEKFGVSRQQQDEFAALSQERAGKALASGLFDPEIVPVEVKERRTMRAVTVDEHPRPDTTVEKLASLRTVFQKDGTVTAGNSSGINDGAAALVLMRESVARSRGRKPLGRLLAMAKGGTAPEIMGYAPTVAIARVLEKTKLSVDDIDVVELNEAFAAQAVAVIRDAGLDPERTNPNGGAIALGHPVGATGAILTLKLLHELRRREAELGMVTMCIGGGQALAAVFQVPGD